MRGRVAEKRLAALSFSDVGNRCDVAPSRFKRLDLDEYFTIDAGWIIPALCCAVQVEGPIRALRWPRRSDLFCEARISSRTPIRSSQT
jgi:hypothetical protein